MSGRKMECLVRCLFWAAALGVCLAQTPSSDVTAAHVIALSGDVSVMKDSTPWALHVGDAVHPRQMIFTGPDGMVKFQVSDGSTFEVYPNSRFTFRNNTDWKDLIDLWIGRVKVQIQKLGGQPNPNRIHTPTAVISVRGTVFDVEVEDEEATTLVEVEEGQVAVRHRLMPSEKLLNAGEWLRVYKNQPLARNSADKGTFIRSALRSMTDALYSIVLRGPQVGGPIPGGSGPGLPGDHGAKPPGVPGGSTGPAPPPAPPPPPPGK